MAEGTGEKVGSLVASLGLDLKDFEEALKTAKLQITDAEKSMKSSMQKVGDSISSVGRKMRTFGKEWSLYVTAPIVGMGVAALKAEKDFEFTLAKITGIIGVSKEQVGSWRNELLDMAGALGKTPKELAEGLFFVTSAGRIGADTLDILKEASRLLLMDLGK